MSAFDLLSLKFILPALMGSNAKIDLYFQDDARPVTSGFIIRG